jgi:hypothetical protein
MHADARGFSGRAQRMADATLPLIFFFCGQSRPSILRAGKGCVRRRRRAGEDPCGRMDLGPVARDARSMRVRFVFSEIFFTNWLKPH